MNRISGKTAIVTGASSGIGQACSELLAEYNVNLILMARREQRLNQLKTDLLKNHDIKIVTIKCDVSNRKDIGLILKDITDKNMIDILINSAGLALGLGKIDDGDIDDWETMIDTNIKGLLYVSREIISHMRKNDTGHIINIGSVAGDITYPGGNIYCASKAAVKTLSDAMNLDVVGTGIRVSNIAPGAVDTEFSNVRFKGDNKKADCVYTGFKPLTGRDIADLIIYILNTPAHVNIQNTTIMPTSQRNPYILHREE